MNKKEQNFSQLKKLLKLKKQELPPPGYLNHFSTQVIARIRESEAHGRQTSSAGFQAETSWLVNFIQLFSNRPGLVGGFATSLCLLLVLGAVFAEQTETEPASNNIFAISETERQPSANLVASLPNSQLIPASDSSGIMASPTPITSLQPAAALFGQPSSASLFQSASFAPAAR